MFPQFEQCTISFKRKMIILDLYCWLRLFLLHCCVSKIIQGISFWRGHVCCSLAIPPTWFSLITLLFPSGESPLPSCVQPGYPAFPYRSHRIPEGCCILPLAALPQSKGDTWPNLDQLESVSREILEWERLLESIQLVGGNWPNG